MSIHELQAALTAVNEKREALRAAADAGEGIGPAVTLLHDAKHMLEAAARRVAEGAGEPAGVASLMPGASGFTHAAFEAANVPPGTNLYTTPPSADALVEALERLMRAKGFAEIDMAKQAAEQALAKHKENTDGR
jgi:hypothetical protein